MHLNYEDIPADERQTHRRRARRIAEWDALRAETSGSTDARDLVLQLRHRGRISARRAFTLFLFLLAVILLGLAYYLGLPFWQSAVDGRRLTFASQVSAIQEELAGIETQVTEQAEALATALEGSLTTLDKPTDEWIYGHVELDDGLLFYGDFGTLWRANSDGSFPENPGVETPTDSAIYGHVALDDGLLFYGDDGTLWRANSEGNFRENPGVETPTDAVILGHVALDDGLLFYGSGGTLWRANSDGSFPENPGVETPTDSVIYGHVALDDGLLFYGDFGNLWRANSDGSFPENPGVETPTDAVILGHVALDDGLLFYGSGGALWRANSDGSLTEDPVIETPTDGSINGHVELDDGLLFYGSGGTLLSANPDGSFPEDAQIDTPSDHPSLGHVELDDGLLFYGLASTFLLQSNRDALRLRDQLSEAPTITEETGALANQAPRLWHQSGVVLAFAPTLQPHLAGRPDVVAAVETVRVLRAQAETQAADLAAAEASLSRLRQFPNSLLRQEEAANFETFMTGCRAGIANPSAEEGNPEAVTLACLDGWRAQLAAERDTVWDTLAQQVPPGILLLFLLATLGGLYRYNMRMAGFHHSRADAIEAMGLGFAREDWDEVIRLSDALAADKVEFGRGSTPSDQAVEIAKAIAAARA